VRSARKHIGWTVQALPGGAEFRARMNLIETCAQQVAAVGDWFDELADRGERMPTARRAPPTGDPMLQ